MGFTFQLRHVALALVLSLLAMVGGVTVGGCADFATARQEAASKQTAATNTANAAGAAVTAGTANLAARDAELASLRQQVGTLQAQLTAANATGAQAQLIEQELANARAVLLDREAQAGQLREQLAALEEAKRAAEAEAAALEARIAAADQTAAGGDSPENPGTTLGSLLGTVVPGIGVSLPILGGLAYKYLAKAKAAQQLAAANTTTNTALTNIVRSIDLLAEIAPEVAAAFTKHHKVIDATQGSIGKAYVDQAQGKPVVVPNTATT